MGRQQEAECLHRVRDSTTSAPPGLCGSSCSLTPRSHAEDTSASTGVVNIDFRRVQRTGVWVSGSGRHGFSL